MENPLLKPINKGRKTTRRRIGSVPATSLPLRAMTRVTAGRARIRLRIEPKFNFWGEPLPRYAPSDLLRNALLRRAVAADGFLHQALTRLPGIPAGTVAIRSAVFDHFQEGDYQMVFRVRLDLAHVVGPRRLCVLVSKGDAASARVAVAESRLLRQWSSRAPERVVTPLSSEWIHLPAEAQAKARARLFVYVTPWLTTFHELGVTSDLRFFVNEHPIQRFPASWTDRIKARILACCLALYHPGRGLAVKPPLIGAGDMMITRPVKGEMPSVKMIAARGTLPAPDLVACLRIYLDYAGEWGGRRFTLRPDDPAWLWAAVREGLVESQGIAVQDVRQALGVLGLRV